MTSPDYPLYLAAERGNVDAVKFLLQHGSDVNSACAPLVAAARFGCELCVELLLDYGADINICLNGETALYTACINRHFVVAEVLIDCGADPNCNEYESATDHAGFVAYHLLTEKASRYDANFKAGCRVLGKLFELGAKVDDELDKVALTELLLMHGCVEEAKTVLRTVLMSELGKFPFVLYYAALYDWHDYVTLLLDNGVGINFCYKRRKRFSKVSSTVDTSNDSSGNNDSEDDNVVNGINADSTDHSATSDSGPNSVDNVGKTCLIGACEAGHTSMVEFLLSKGADPNPLCTQRSGTVPLLIAASNKNVAILRALLGAGANPSALGCETIMDEHVEKSSGAGAKQVWCTALHIACKNGDTRSVKWLLGAGIDVNISDASGATPLHIAAQTGRLEVIQILLDRDADTNRQCGNKETPLGVLCRGLSSCCHPRQTQVSFKWRRSKAADHKVGSTGSVMSELGGCSSCCVFQSVSPAIDDKSSETGTRKIEDDRCVDDHVAVLKLLIEHGADVNAVTGCSNETPLYLASCSHRTDSVEILLAAGANANGTSEKNPLCIACANSLVANVSALLSHGADPNLCELNLTSCSRTFPLCLAAEANEINIVQMLLREGADVHLAQDKVGRTSLHRAVGAIRKIYQSELERLDYRTQVVEALLESGADINVADRLGVTALQCAVTSLRPSNLRVYCNKLEQDIYMRRNMRMDISTFRRLVLPTIQKFVCMQLEAIDVMIGPGGGATLDDTSVHTVSSASSGGGDIDLAMILESNPIGRLLIPMFLQAGATSKWLSWISREVYTTRCNPDSGSLELCKAVVLAGYKPLAFAVTKQNLPEEIKVKELLETECGAIPSIMRLCRVAVRSHLFEVGGHQSIVSSVNALPLPDELISYLLFEGPLSDVTLKPPVITDEALLNMLRLRDS